MVPTDTGLRHYILRLADNAAANAQIWDKLAKLDGMTRIGKPKAVRAVGLANGQNPISIVVPCHRVIGSDGSLTGYGGGLNRKKWLLKHEGVPT